MRRFTLTVPKLNKEKTNEFIAPDVEMVIPLARSPITLEPMIQTNVLKTAPLSAVFPIAKCANSTQAALFATMDSCQSVVFVFKAL